MVNREELARRIAERKGYKKGEVEDVLKEYEDVVVDALQNGEGIKHGKLFKIGLHIVPEKRAWDGLNKRYYTRETKRVPKTKLLSKLTDIELPVEEED